MFPMKHTQAYTIKRPVLVEDIDRGTVALDYANATTHTVKGFLHETTDQTTTGDSHIRSEELTAVFTCSPDADIQKSDLIETGEGGVWLVETIPNRETSPFTGWQPTCEARCIAWQG